MSRGGAMPDGYPTPPRTKCDGCGQHISRREESDHDPDGSERRCGAKQSVHGARQQCRLAAGHEPKRHRFTGKPVPLAAGRWWHLQCTPPDVLEKFARLYGVKP